MTKKRIAVLMGGPSSEREVSLATGRAVLQALTSLGLDAVGVDWEPGRDLLTLLRESRAEVVWLALHGTYGEDGCVQGLCEIVGLPYTGSGLLSSALAMDKVASRRLFASHGLAVPEWRIHRGLEDARAIGLPLVVKPSREGSSVGVTIVHREADLEPALATAARCRGEVLVERYVAGREIQVGILDDAPLGTVEIRPAVEFYDYQAKYQRNDTTYLCPAPLSHAEDARLRELGLAAHRALGCRSYSRVDFILADSGTAFLLEVNTLPGMTERSLIPKMAAAAGLSYATLCERILAGAALKV
jgi:D-alanine-D-alanine ligase